jgi:ribosomal protein S27E
MLQQTPIHCHKCNALIGYAENFTNYVIPYPGIKCMSCGEIVIQSTNTIL